MTDKPACSHTTDLMNEHPIIGMLRVELAIAERERDRWAACVLKRQAAFRMEYEKVKLIQKLIAIDEC